MVLTAGLAFAEEAKAPETKPIPAELYARYVVADNNVLRAEALIAQKKAERDSVIAMIRQFCGDGFVADVDPKDEAKGVCRPKK
jgi:hypothetical protein